MTRAKREAIITAWLTIIKYVLKAENLFKKPTQTVFTHELQNHSKPALVQATVTSSLMAIL